MALALAGLAIAVSASGCCCGMSSNRCSPCGQAPSPCSTGNCSPSFYPPAGGGGGQFYQGADASGMNFGGTQTVASTQPVGYPTTAMAPTQLLPN
ncbi:MAG: hypothetical protein C0478_14645 [Planctomyces sp.]|nr:hypothetical protein [Planctomyces sp.]